MKNWEEDRGRISTATDIAKLLITLNGGAVLALLTFWGHSPNALDLKLAARAIEAFNGGLGSAVLSALAIYTTHGIPGMFRRRTEAKIRRYGIAGGLLMTVTSMGLFSGGTMMVARALAI